MGARVSIQLGTRHFDGSEWLSATLKHHWGGPEFPETVLEWVKMLRPQDPENPHISPTDRLEPDALLISLVVEIVTLSNQGNFGHSLRLVPTPGDCDNSDWGHHIIWTDTLTIERR